MKVILLKDVKKVGKKDQTVEVSDGYAINFLIPNKLAVQVTKKSLEVLDNQKQIVLDNQTKAKADALE
ncbi:MAG: 50S ribosomal protein L9, partial [Bacilli bacterium]